MSELIPAATVALLRDVEQGLEVLLLRRSPALKFAGGHWVFPGGRIDSGDYPDKNAHVTVAARYAAVREAFEESSLHVEREALISVSHWLPPKSISRRFSTWFFVSEYQGLDSVVVDQGEIDHYQWCTPQQALQLIDTESIKVMVPTFVTLTELANQGSVADALAFYHTREPLHYEAVDQHQTEQGRCMLYEGDAGYASNNPDKKGDRHRFFERAGRFSYEYNVKNKAQ